MRQNGSIDYENTDNMAYISTMDTPCDVYVEFHFTFIKVVFHSLLSVASVYSSTNNLCK